MQNTAKNVPYLAKEFLFLKLGFHEILVIFSTNLKKFPKLLLLWEWYNQIIKPNLYESQLSQNIEDEIVICFL